MVRRLVVLVVLALFAGNVELETSWAKPAKHRKVRKKRKRAKPPGKPTPEPAASGSASSDPAEPPSPAPDSGPDATTAPPAPAPEPAPASPATTAPPPPAVNLDPIPASRPPARAPPAAPKLAMRQKAHGGFTDDLDCSACHTSDGWSLSSTAGSSGFDHDRTGFPLRGAHVQSACSGCHTGMAKPATNCAGCHRDPHQGRNDGTCAECHTAVAWSDTNTLERHRMTRMPLTGRHATLECSACHKRSPERMTSDVPADCYACHRDDYHDQTVHPVHDGSTGQALFPRECGLCHQTSAWTPAFADPLTLPRMTMSATRSTHDRVFVLSTGSHRTAECSTCHVDRRRTKLVRCDGCHQALELRMQHRAPVARAATGCLRCHPRGAAR